MSGKERREQILNILKDSGKPVPGVELARLLQVSRQVIVQDMALLRDRDSFHQPGLCGGQGEQL